MIDEKKLSEKTLQKALGDLAIGSIAPAIISYFSRSASRDVNEPDDISEDELAYLQVILMKDAARDVGLPFDSAAQNNITEFKEKLKQQIIKKAILADDALKQKICIELNYCDRVGKNWRVKLIFGTGLALAALLADLTGLSVACILYLLSIGYFDELCECKSGGAMQV